MSEKNAINKIKNEINFLSKTEMKVLLKFMNSEEKGKHFCDFVIDFCKYKLKINVLGKQETHGKSFIIIPLSKCLNSLKLNAVLGSSVAK